GNAYQKLPGVRRNRALSHRSTCPQSTFTSGQHVKQAAAAATSPRERHQRRHRHRYPHPLYRRRCATRTLSRGTREAGRVQRFRRLIAVMPEAVRTRTAAVGDDVQARVGARASVAWARRWRLGGGGQGRRHCKVVGPCWRLARALAWVFWPSGGWRPRSLPPPAGRALARRAVGVGCESASAHAAARRCHALGARNVSRAVLLPHGAGADSLRALASPRMRVLPLDVTDADSVAAAARAVQQDLQDSGCELQAVVNNAGILNVGETEWMDIEELRKTIDVNTIGQVRVAQAFLPLLRKSKGRVVNVNSVAGRLPCAGLAPYVISKYASVAFTECLKVDMTKFSVSVHSIEPAIYMTPMAEGSKVLLKKKFDAIPEKIMNDYGHRYIEKFMKAVELVFFVFSKPPSKILEVVDAIEDAILSEDPQDCYYPGERSKLGITLKDEVKYVQGYLTKLIYNLW
ncbi:Alcohol dehydrogenase 1, partial [Gryllus bimaculatus]